MNKLTTQSAKLIFVHDFGLDATSWTNLELALRQDSTLTQNLAIFKFSYPVPWTGKTASFDALTEIFKQWLVEEDIYSTGVQDINTHIQSTPIYFIGHGLGGIIILNMIKSYLEDNIKGINEKFLRSIREIVFFSTPLEAYDDIETLRQILPARKSFFSNSISSRYLTKINQEIDEILDFTNRNVINATEFKSKEIPIATLLFYGESDPKNYDIPNWFPKEAVRKIPGNQRSIIDIKYTDTQYETFKNFILDPIGHKNVFEVEYLINTLKVEPLSNQHVIITYGDNQRELVSENKGVYGRLVTFSKNNICTSLYKLRYGTTSPGGGIQPYFYPPYDNETSQEKMDLYYKDGKEFTFEFTPKNHQSYALNVEVYKGYDGKDGQNLHLHFGKGSYFYRHIIIKLDLSSFANPKYFFKQKPVAYLLSEDGHNCADTSKYRVPLNRLLPTSVDEKQGIWEWEFFNIRTGVIDKVWDIEHEKLNQQGLDMDIIAPEEKGKHFQFAHAFANLLFECTSIRDTAVRKQIIEELDPTVAMWIRDNVPPYALLVDIIKVSLNRNMLDDFMNTLEVYEGPTIALQEAKKFLLSASKELLFD